MLDYYRYKEVLKFFHLGKIEEAKNILTELQTKHIALTDENKLLKSQIQEYEEILYIAKNLVFDGFSYWLMTGTIRQGPFCEYCYTYDGMLIRLVELKHAWRCSHCESVYITEHKKKQQVKMQQKKQCANLIPFSKYVQLR